MEVIATMAQGFWKRWSSEYITSLQQRPKCERQHKHFEIDDVVVLKDPNLPQNMWLLGRIIQVRPGKDDKV